MALPGLLRTHHCGELRASDLGKKVTLCGWVNKSRDLGGLHFVDIRDKFGLTQLSFAKFTGDLNILKQASLESTILAIGTVSSRPEEAKNKNMETGEVEVLVEEFQILAQSDIATLPFLPFGSVEATEDLRLKYRYLDLRTKKLQDILLLRSKILSRTRSTLNEEGFVEVETPILYKSTPEGARDYVVPSRVHPGEVYALPQSPQTLKQLLMIGGTDKYFQIARCFRDEDLRADRQPEFTQIDIEVSFATQDYIYNLVSKMVRTIFDMSATYSIPKMPFVEAMDLYGSDKPDVRFGLKHMIVTDLFKDSSFSIFKQVADNNGLIKAIFLPEAFGALARKDIDALTDVVKPHGGSGVAWFKQAADGLSGGVSKFIDEALLGKLTGKSEEKGHGLWLFCAHNDHAVAHACADAVRRHLAKTLKLHKDGFHFLWVYDFPLLEWNADEKRFFACHHPFTSPKHDLIPQFMKGEHNDLLHMKADAYDIVCNGYEIGGGSVRIFNPETQGQMFKVLGMTLDEARYQFGFFMDALKYGTPPHAGLAFGLDRITMLLAGTDSIRDVIAFPKTASASDLMSGCPSIPNPSQLKELHFEWTTKK